MTKNNSTKAYKPAASIVKLAAPIFIFTILIFSSCKLAAQVSKDSPGIFYAVTGNGLKDTSWLFGTYHLINSDYLNEIQGVNRAFVKSKGLVVEIVMDSSKMAEVQAMGMMKNKTLSSLLDKPFSDSLEIELKNSIGVGIAQMNQLKPITVTLTLSIVYLMKNNSGILNKYGGLPLDINFVKNGKKLAKNVTALETVEEQMNLLFNRTSDEEQVNQLKLFLRNKNEMIQLGDELLQNWFDGDLNSMHTIYEKSIALSGEKDYLVKGRNDHWMKVLPGLITGEPQFIAVGALHLAGPDGLVKQLQGLGYTVTPIKQ